MILIKETIKKFGYSPNTLSKNSHKLVLWQCEKCGIIGERVFRDCRKYCPNCKNKRVKCYYCCSKCGGNICRETAINGSGMCNKCSRKGKGLDTRFTKDLLIKLNHIKKLPLTKIAKLYNVHAATIKKYFKRFDIINKIYPLSGKDNWFYGKPQHTVNFTTYNKNRFRSSWEANFAKWLDLSEIKWKYEPETFSLGNYSYTPDFYLPELDCYIEIKGRWMGMAKRKFIYVKKFFNIDLVLFNKKKLINLGIINA